MPGVPCKFKHANIVAIKVDLWVGVGLEVIQTSHKLLSPCMSRASRSLTTTLPTPTTIRTILEALVA